ncbi:MAG: hypothetical protein WD200_03960 [Candidatus Andersenbacteria bacterium]
MHRFHPSRQAQGGFTFVEVIVATFILGITTVGIMGLATLGVRYSFENERQNVAQALVNQQLETARSLPYEGVGYVDAVGREPDGVLQRAETISRNQQSYELTLVVELVDDPDNGLLPAGILDENNADYKEVTAHAAWTSAGGVGRSVHATTILSKGSNVCIPGTPNACPGTQIPDEGSCIPNTSCPASGVCPPVQAEPFCPPGAAACPQCYSDSHCSAGEACNTATNLCEELVGACSTSADCGAGQVCDSRQCVAACSENADCTGGEICNTSTGICTLPCNGDASCSCPSGQYCNPGSGLCDDPIVIDPPPFCIEGTCAGGAWCDPDSDRCKPPCDTDIQCGYGQVCKDNGNTPGKHCDDDDPPGGCSDDSQCPSGQACSDGACQGSWCSPVTPIINCAEPVDPGCPSFSCLGGRFVTVEQLKQNTTFDPMCGSHTTSICEKKTVWTACPACSGGSGPRQCSDFVPDPDHEGEFLPLDNDGDGRANQGDPGCYVGWNIQNAGAYKASDNHETSGECIDGLDNDNPKDGRADFKGACWIKETGGTNPVEIWKPIFDKAACEAEQDFFKWIPKDPKCSSFTDTSESEGDVAGCKLRTYNGHDYLFCNQQKNQEDAGNWCEANEYMLAKINNTNERDWLHTTMQGYFAVNGNAWVGASQSSSQDRPGDGWSWLGGGILKEISALWKEGEPNDCCSSSDGHVEDNEENHAHFGWGGPYLTDIPGSQTNSFICENDVDDPVDDDGGSCSPYGSPDPWISLPAGLDTGIKFGTSLAYSGAYGSGKFVVVGNGRTSYSTDANNWTPVNNGISGGRAIAYGNNKFVAVGNNGSASYSSDGINWTVLPGGSMSTGIKFGTDVPVSITYGNGMFIAVGGIGKASYSFDGINWTSLPAGTNTGIKWGTTGTPSSVAYGNGKFVVVGTQGKASYSEDGVNWTALPGGSVDEGIKFGTSNATSVTYGNDKFIVVGPQGKASYSNDGINWTALPFGSVDTGIKFGTSTANSIIYGKGVFIVVGASGKASYSNDGINWEPSLAGYLTGIKFGTTAWARGIFYGDNTFVVVGDGGRASYSDGSQPPPPVPVDFWNILTPGASTGIKFGSTHARAAAYGNNKFVVGGDAGKASYSEDGSNWTTLLPGTTTGIEFGTTGVSAIAYGGDKFVAVGNSGKASYSEDGIDWTSLPAGLDTGIKFGTNTARSVAYGKGVFVVVGINGFGSYSHDGINWTALPRFPAPASGITFGSSNAYSVTYGNDKFVVVGHSGKAAYSEDGINWTALPAGTDTGIRFGASEAFSVTYGSGTFVVVGTQGKASYSEDGINWTALPAGSVDSGIKFGTSDAYSVTYGNGKFVVAGGYGNASHSSNGVDWTSLPAGADTGIKFGNDVAFGTSSVYAVASGNNTFVAVGYGGKASYSSGCP